MESVFLLMMDGRVYILPEHFLFRRKISRSPSLTMMMDQAGQGSFIFCFFMVSFHVLFFILGGLFWFNLWDLHSGSCLGRNSTSKCQIVCTFSVIQLNILSWHHNGVIAFALFLCSMHLNFFHLAGERENSKLQSNWLLVLTCTTWDFFCGDSKLMRLRKPFKFLI